MVNNYKAYDDTDKDARYIVHTIHMGQPVFTRYFYYYHNAVFCVINNECYESTISDMNYYPLAKYREIQRVYHFTEDPEWLRLHQFNVNTG